MLISPKARVHDAFDPSVADAYGGEGKTPVEYGSTASLRVMCGAFGRTELTIVGCAPPGGGEVLLLVLRLFLFPKGWRSVHRLHLKAKHLRSTLFYVGGIARCSSLTSTRLSGRWTDEARKSQCCTCRSLGLRALKPTPDIARIIRVSRETMRMALRGVGSEALAQSKSRSIGRGYG